MKIENVVWTPFEGQQRVKYALLTVTPELAEAWLANKPANRFVVATNLKRLQYEASHGEFSPWVQPLLLDRSGRLLDGQHRLEAIVETGKSLVLLVIRGIDRDDVFGKIDTGASRTLSHWVSILGCGDLKPTHLATLIGYHYNHTVRGVRPTAQVQKPVHHMLEHYVRYREEIDGAMTILPELPAKNLIRKPLLAFLFLAFERHKKDSGADFLDRMEQAHRQGKRHPYFLLWEVLDKDRARRARHFTQTERAALCIKSYNAHILGQKIDVLRWLGNATVPEPFPTIGHSPRMARNIRRRTKK
jgi:hypothetical protein